MIAYFPESDTTDWNEYYFDVPYFGPFEDEPIRRSLKPPLNNLFNPAPKSILLFKSVVLEIVFNLKLPWRKTEMLKRKKRA